MIVPAPKDVTGARRRGATLVEAAIILCLFVQVVFGIYEYGRLVMMKQLMDNAAREGARLAVVHTYDLATSDIQAQVRTYLAGQDAQLANLTIQVYQTDGNGNNVGPWAGANFGQPIAVQVDADYQPVLPLLLFMNATVHIRAETVMYSEAN